MTFIGFHGTFLIQHWLGNQGMPRRYADYLPTDGFTTLNTISSIFSFILGTSVLPFIYNVFRSYRYGRVVTADDPWGHGNSLEWATTCPPPRHNFYELPRIRSERPAFELHYPHMIERLRAEAHTGRRARTRAHAGADQPPGRSDTPVHGRVFPTGFGSLTQTQGRTERGRTVVSDHLAALSAAGVSIWLDDLSRARLASGNLASLVADRHVVGVTTNPTIFAKAITTTDAYTEQIAQLAVRRVDADTGLRELTTFDVRWAADVLRPVFEETEGIDGRVSIEVDPRIARDTARTIAEAKALWWMVDRPNVFIKIPAARQGLP